VSVSDIHDSSVSPTSLHISSGLHWYQQFHLLPLMQYYSLNIQPSVNNMSWSYMFPAQSLTQTVSDLWTADWGTWRWMWHDTFWNLQGTIHIPCTV